MLFIILVIVLSFPFVQTKLGNYATKRLNEEFKTNINIARISLQLNSDVELKDIYVQDYKNDTLIAIKELNTSILSFRNLAKGRLVFGDIDIENLIFNIKTYPEETETNLDVFVRKFETDNPSTTSTSFLLSSSDVSVYNSKFRLIDENKEQSTLLNLNNLNINATNFLINGSDVSTRINTLTFIDNRGVKVENLMTNFGYTLKGMTFDNLQIKTPESIINGDLVFKYNREDLQYFTDKVFLEANFNNSKISLNELNVFYNEFGKHQTLTFNAHLTGTLNSLKASNLKINTNSRTKIYGDIYFENLFNSKEHNFVMDGDFTNLTSTYQDLTALLPNVLGEAIPSTFNRIGVFTIKGSSKVTSTAVNADIEMNTGLGFVDANLKIDKINDIDNADYKGKVIFKEFDLGTFLNDPNIGIASLNFDVNGEGFVMESLNTRVSGDVFSIGYNNYNYKNIKVAGTVKNKIFDGNLVVNDPNLKMNFNGLVDFSETVRKYDFVAIVDHADLNTLNFVTKDSISEFKSRVKMNMNSSNLDDAYGKISFEKTRYKNEHDVYKFERFDISSTFNGDERYITFNSPDIIEGELKGRFNTKDIAKLFENSIGYIYTNYIPYKVEPDQSIDFHFNIYNKIVEVFYPELELGANTFIRGTVESNEENFKLTFKSPEIKIPDYFANNIEVQVDNSNPLFNTYVEVNKINTKFYNVSDFNLINVTVNDTLFMRSEFNGGKKGNDMYNLSFYHTINEANESVIGFKKSDVTIKNYKWNINQNEDRFHKVSFNKKLTKFNVEKFTINHNESEIKLSGFLRDSTQKDIKLNFSNVDLAKITPDLDSLQLSGNVNGKLDVLQKNGSYLPNSTVVIDDLKINEFLIGSFDASVTGNESLTNYKVDANIKDDDNKTFRATGDIYVNGKQSNINVNLNFNKFNLYPLNPLLEDVLSNIRGDVTGKVSVSGNLKRPSIDGDVVLQNAGLGVPYLNVDYRFSDNASMSLKNQSFIFNNIGLTDTKYNSKGNLSGKIMHQNFSKWGLGLNISSSNLLILDTEETEESLYYGTGFIGGMATINGPTDELVIKVIAETKKGTVFKIPLSDAESFGDNSYIHFITKEEKEAKKEGRELVFEEIRGLELDFDLDVTEDAEVEIIIDKDTGHSLKGRGNGGLLVEINTNGKFDMWGDFAVFEGVYNFAYGGIIQKEFIVQPGGTIAWEGSPYDAQINMEAVYKTQANPSPLLDNPISRSIPVELNIALNGSLEQFDPVFSFEFPNVSSSVKSELQYSLESDEIKQNQALYLISTGSFSQGLNEVNFSGTIAERLNGIINGIFSNSDGKLNIGLNYEAGQNTPDYQTDDRVGFTLQTQINDRVLINGKVGVPVGGATETVVAGDVEISFLLNEEGTLTAKVFNRENSIQNFGEQIGYTQGVGISYNVDFDTFKELLQKIFNNKEEEESILEEVPEEEKQEALPDHISFKTSSNN
ncbi:translocation/assembly module TamB domain-containing protein [Neotamlana laminarinivorans]|uniref:Translocation/assembly module TamB domain-containing protein n=1 Tax=Neotamlana laminarinivorans TaxID=2883124 RepID=A0A9X1I2R3_9FLAO|nr:translocation/assembly module TamB [Tamlana laminarinivorans]MCB4800106.1 translocation/assembly module TamB domain-containing protein [Tamlana laminarinivorans]